MVSAGTGRRQEGRNERKKDGTKHGIEGGKIRDSEMEISVTRGVICDADAARQTAAAAAAATVEVLSIALRLACSTG